MVFVCSIVLLVFAGGIHSSPLPGNFSFEVDPHPFQVISVRFNDDAVLDCKTNDPSALVALTPPKHGSNDLPDDPGKITQYGSTFTVHNVLVYDAGRYKCVAEGKDGKKIAKFIHLHIDTNVVDIAIIPFEAKRIVKGSNLKYVCESTVMGSLTWYKAISKSSSVALPSPKFPAISIKELGNNRTDLIFSHADDYDSGDYKCELTYKGTTMDKGVSVEFLDPQPAEIVSTSSLNVWAVKDSNGDYGDIKLVCNTAGFPSPIVTWTRDGQLITKCYKDEPCAKTERYIQSRYYHPSEYYMYGLEIVKPRYPDDDAVFRCKVQNAAGSDQRVFVVVVPFPPALDKSKLSYTWFQGQTKPIDIPCVLAQGSPRPKFTWDYRMCWAKPPSDQVCLPWKPIKQIPIKHQVRELAKRSILEIQSQKMPQILNFKCSVKNVKGEDTMVVSLFERPNPNGKR